MVSMTPVGPLMPIWAERVGDRNGSLSPVGPWGNPDDGTGGY